VEVALVFLPLGRFLGGGGGTTSGISGRVLLDLVLTMTNLYLELCSRFHRRRQTVDAVFCLR
jgi:hypothetical protein